MLRAKLNRIFSTLILAVMLLLCACSGSRKNVGGRGHNSDKLRAGDVIELKFVHHPDFDQTVVVPPDGKVSLHALGDLKIINLTPQILKRLLSEKYASLLPTPQIDVDVLKASSFQIYVGGELQRPGIVKFKGNLSVIQGIQLAGGIKDGSTDYEVIVFRKRNEGGMKIHKFKIKKDGTIDKAMNGFTLAPYDVVFVVRSLLGRKDNGKLI